MTSIDTANGRRAIAVHVDVLGTRQDVWQAIASGPGISSWFVPTAFDEVDGVPVTIRMRFGPGMEASAAVTVWDPPGRLVAEGESRGNGAPCVTNDWRVDELGGGLCRVTIINSVESDKANWDGMLESVAQGWPGFLRTLRLYLSHFRGQRSTLVQLVRPVAGSEETAWSKLTVALQCGALGAGQQWSTPASAPPLSGIAEYVSRNPNDILLRLQSPAPGALAIGSYRYGEQTMVALNFYLYGDGATGVASGMQSQWAAWLGSHAASQ